MQSNILEKNPDLDLQVLAVWFNVLGGDDRSRWPADLLSDSRVAHYWDPDGETGFWFADHRDNYDTHGYVGGLAWDIYYLFGPDAQWNDFPGPEIVSGTTILGTSSRLGDAVGAL